MMERVQKSQKTMKALNQASASNGKGLDKATLDSTLDRLIETVIIRQLTRGLKSF